MNGIEEEELQFFESFLSGIFNSDGVCFSLRDVRARNFFPVHIARPFSFLSTYLFLLLFFLYLDSCTFTATSADEEEGRGDTTFFVDIFYLFFFLFDGMEEEQGWQTLMKDKGGTRMAVGDYCVDMRRWIMGIARLDRKGQLGSYD